MYSTYNFFTFRSQNIAWFGRIEKGVISYDMYRETGKILVQKVNKKGQV